ncbi:hypothetical protein F441_13018 [Phytophthora nicotianae CJ01A1]|uniref:Uncharacterized protein n=2 Tax=Phytophthora nicotianae TaxID=4792 RepID=W2Q0G9_PHYN3|nr:hypothetical protein PPTG_23342 [Phytophthora nicotianae INRA-310]ETN06708.1 hypothetical protein PPTG_23342 [Phytophthora nicotianae INRA-310]ETP11467.1 hypothetical protein F441_13018 [Phytophthora nicotianae CJ01A1]
MSSTNVNFKAHHSENLWKIATTSFLDSLKFLQISRRLNGEKASPRAQTI